VDPGLPLGVLVLVAVLLGALLGGAVLYFGVILPLRMRLRRAQRELAGTRPADAVIAHERSRAVLAAAAASAGLRWYFARRGSARQSGAEVSRLRSSYFRGLNYLLNEQQDKAIEVFLQIAEVDSDTVETHLALGNLFRRRGEVDRAIRVHENLIARPTLSAEQKTAAVLELGEDYMRAGLLDRAEALFTDLVALEARAPSALKHLIGIYQQERDCTRAIDHARRLERLGGDSQGTVIAHYYCELADQARMRHDREGARRALADAFMAEPECVRGTLIEGRLALDAETLPGALAAFQRVVERDLEFVPELPAHAGLLREARRSAGRARVPARTDRSLPGHPPVLALTRIVERGTAIAPRSRCSPRARQAALGRGLGRSSGSRSRASRRGARQPADLDELTRKLLAGQAIYRCTRCGFGARAHHWQCPSCKSWGSVKPIHGVAGD
jgi:lipopolysaccharide biosynthesis regulator YciM